MTFQTDSVGLLVQHVVLCHFCAILESSNVYISLILDYCSPKIVNSPFGLSSYSFSHSNLLVPSDFSILLTIRWRVLHHLMLGCICQAFYLVLLVLVGLIALCITSTSFLTKSMEWLSSLPYTPTQMVVHFHPLALGQSSQGDHYSSLGDHYCWCY